MKDSTLCTVEHNKKKWGITLKYSQVISEHLLLKFIKRQAYIFSCNYTAYNVWRVARSHTNTTRQCLGESWILKCQQKSFVKGNSGSHHFKSPQEIMYCLDFPPKPQTSANTERWIAFLTSKCKIRKCRTDTFELNGLYFMNSFLQICKYLEIYEFDSCLLKRSSFLSFTLKF